MLDKKKINDVEELVKIAKEQNGKINSNIIFMTIDTKEDEEQEIINYLIDQNIEIIYEDVEPDVLTNHGDEEYIKPFDPSKIDISMKPMTMDSLIKRISNDEIEFNSAFQRKAGLWSDIQKSQLIESILLRIPLPAFYFDATNENKWVVIDGLQRTTTIKQFVIDKSLKLKGMEFLVDLNGLTYSNLPRSFIRRIDETQINVYLVNPATPENVKFNIFKRINTGGLALEAQEIRNALYQGASTKFLEKLASKEEFKIATGESIRTERMLDREFVLRFVAFCYLDINKYNGNIDEYLNLAMIYLNNIDKTELDKIEKKFVTTMNYCFQLFDRYTFRKMGIDGRRRPISKVIFEAWCFQIINMNESDIDTLIKNKVKLKKKFIILCDDYEFSYSLKGSDRRSLQSRMGYIKNIIEEVLRRE
ncbi:MAG: DUF262 domain-containing protein [Lachnotalea sp.]